MPKVQSEPIYMSMAYEIAKLSYAERRQVGCIVVKNHQIISTGYNGTPHGFDNCCEAHDVTKKEVLHAESNALMKIAKSTLSSEDSELYTTTCPCFDCAKLIIQAGVKKVYFCEDYRDMTGIALLESAGIKVKQLIVDRNGI
jgi:dCMP deaminase